MLWRFALIALLLGVGQLAWAQAPKSFQVTIDKSFAVTPVGEAHVIAGKPYYVGVGVHRAMERDGLVYACVSFVLGSGNRRDDFMRKSSLLAANGKVIKRGFFSVSNPFTSSQMKACRTSAPHPAICSRVFPADLSVYEGARVTCQRTNKKASAALLAAPGVFRVPTQIWVQK